jgi:hypothetical protein
MTDKETKSEAKNEQKAEQAVQEQVDVETEQGFRGVKVDPTDNHAYSVEGVTSGEPTPETDHDAALQAQGAVTKFTNKGQSREG